MKITQPPFLISISLFHCQAKPMPRFVRGCKFIFSSLAEKGKCWKNKKERIKRVEKNETRYRFIFLYYWMNEINRAKGELKLINLFRLKPLSFAEFSIAFPLQWNSIPLKILIKWILQEKLMQMVWIIITVLYRSPGNINIK